MLISTALQAGPLERAPQWVGMEGAVSVVLSLGPSTRGREARWSLWDEMRTAHLWRCAQRLQKQVSKSLPMSP